MDFSRLVRAVLGLLIPLGLIGSLGPFGTHVRAAGICGTINFNDWGMLTPAGHLLPLVKQYENMHPCVKINIVPVPSNVDAVTWEKTVLAAGTAPDEMAPSYTMQIFEDISKGWWLDMTPYLDLPNGYIPGNKRWIDSINPILNAQNAWLGNRYYVITNSDQEPAFLYNKDLWKKVIGSDTPPATWDVFMADLAKFKKAGYIGTEFNLHDTYPIAENGTTMSIFEQMVMYPDYQKMDTNKDGIVDIRELTAAMKSGLYSTKNPRYQEAWRLFKDFSQYFQPRALGVTNIDQPFLSGTVATMFRGQYWLPTLLAAKPKFQWGVFPFPQITPASSKYATPGFKGTGVWATWNATPWAVPAVAAKRPMWPATLDFLHYLTAPKQEQIIDNAAGYIATYVGAVKNIPPLLKPYYPITIHPVMAFAAEAALGPEFLKDRIAAQQAYLGGGQDLNTTMSQMQTAMDAAYQRTVKLYNFGQ
jgi:ABC-type glycerol-3-phosphate transport system substrate-binding protein